MQSVDLHLDTKITNIMRMAQKLQQYSGCMDQHEHGKKSSSLRQSASSNVDLI